MNRILRAAALGVAFSVAVPGVAYAHVTLRPNELPAGSFSRIDVRVPDEMDNANVSKVELQFPAEYIDTSYEAVPGWNIAVNKVKLDAPIKNEDGDEVNERVDTVTFTATGSGIQPGQFQDFPLSVALPDKANTTLTFKALQTYSNGQVVRWIGEPNTAEPAPQVKLTAASNDTGSTGTTAASKDDDSNTLSIVALVIGALGLLAGLVGLLIARSTKSKASS